MDILITNTETSQHIMSTIKSLVVVCKINISCNGTVISESQCADCRCSSQSTGQVSSAVEDHSETCM